MELASLIINLVFLSMSRAPGAFAAGVAGGIALAAACWYACTVYTRLWNTRFHLSGVHHLLCGFAAVCTVLIAIVLTSIAFARDAALASIADWQAQLNVDEDWAERTFAEAYDAVRALGIEDFSKAPLPGHGGSFIPTNSDRSRATAAAVYANEACNHFDRARPLLSRIVWSNPGVPSATILEDVRAWQARDPNYPPSRAIEIAAAQIRDGLEPQVPRVVSVGRLALVVLFLGAQAIPFGLVGWAAYRDIRTR